MQYPSPLQTTVRNAGARATKSADLTLTDLIKSIKRRRNMVLWMTLACFLLGVAACLLKTPHYEAVAKVQVQKDNPGPLGISSVINEGPMPSDTIDYNITLQTDAEVLKSEPLAARAIEDLHLEGTRDYQPRFNPLGLVLSVLSPKGEKESPALGLSQSPQRRARLIKIFAQHLTVKVQDGTRLISVQYSDPDPRLANAVVGHLVEDLKNYDFHAHSDSTQEASEWLSKQMAELRKNAEIADTKVSQIQQATGVFTMGDTDANGRLISVSVVLSRLQDLNNSLTAAQTNSILKEAVYRAVQTHGAESISGLAGNILSGAAPVVVNSLNNIQTLRAQEANVKASMAQNSTKYGPNFPSMVQMQNQIDEIERSIHAEQERIKEHAKSDYVVAQQTESNIRSLYDKQKAQADAMNNKTIEYMVAKQEADQERGLYNDIYRRIREADAVEGLRRSNIIVLDAGSVPGKPKSPNVPIYLAASVFGGIALGAFLALLMDARDHRLHEIRQIEEDLGVLPYAVIPAPSSVGMSYKAYTSGMSEIDSFSVADVLSTLPADLHYLEGLRTLRAAITNSSGIHPHSVIQITCCEDDGRVAFFSVQLAALFARQGYKTLLVEGDLRKPLLTAALGLQSDEGLSGLLLKTSDADLIHKVKDSQNLDILPAGKGEGLSAELLGTESMKTLVATWRSKYDYVFVTAPPALAVADSILMRGFCDQILLLANFDKTERRAIVRAHHLLSAANEAPEVGVVLCGVPGKSDAYYEYFGSRYTPYGADVKESA